jgi:hypothetical protein
MLCGLSQIILIYFKLTSLQDMNWELTLIPWHLIDIVGACSIYMYLSQLEESHPKTFKILISYLALTIALLEIFIYFFALHMNIPSSERTLGSSLFLTLIPVYAVIILSFGVFLYLLPGMCDPENETERRVPFLIVSYFIVFL